MTRAAIAASLMLLACPGKMVSMADARPILVVEEQLAAAQLSQYRPGQCLPVQTIQVLTRSVRLDPEQSERVARWFNSLPPESNFPLTTFLVGRDGGQTILYLVTGELICGALPILPELNDGFVRALTGEQGA
jgi:hypothetical protein